MVSVVRVCVRMCADSTYLVQVRHVVLRSHCQGTSSAEPGFSWLVIVGERSPSPHTHMRAHACSCRSVGESVVTLVLWCGGGCWCCFLAVQVLLAWVSQKALVVLNLVPARLLLVAIPINTVVLLLMVSIEFQGNSAGNPRLVRCL